MEELSAKCAIAEWYNGKSIFITGGTGFMGKVLVEKLLYSCCGLKAIYLLLRSKRGRTPQQRIEDMYKSPMFDRLKNEQPNAIKKIIPITGEVGVDNLGLNEADQLAIINNVNIVFHCAAILKLDAKLKDAVNLNTEGTSRMLDLAKKIKNLNAFVHYSTCFCSPDLEFFEEKIYPTRDDPLKVIEVCKWINDDAIETATPALLEPHPNTYTYTKRLAENLIENEKNNLPVCIIRPAIVIPAIAEPHPGWVDTLNGPMGLVVGAGKGVIRSMMCDRNAKAQVIPVDMAINASIIVAKKVGTTTERPAKVPVYNLTQDGVIQMTWGEILDQGRKIVYEYPFEQQIWYPDGDFRSSKTVHFLMCIFFHWLPAYFIDFLMLLFCQKRFMIHVQTKVHQGLELLQYFTTRKWSFASDNFLGLVNDMTEADKKVFPLDLKAFPIHEYMVRGILGIRKFHLKEDLSSLPRCRVQQNVLYVLHKVTVYGAYIFALWYLVSLWPLVESFMSTVLNFIQAK